MGGFRAVPCQKTLAVPTLGGKRGTDARNPWQCQHWVANARNPWQCQHWVANARNLWQCQHWVAKQRRVPEIPGSANTGWQKGHGRQKTLAVPELSGEYQKTLAVPTLGGEAAANARNPWQCQHWVAKRRRVPEIPGSASP